MPSQPVPRRDHASEPHIGRPLISAECASIRATHAASCLVRALLTEVCKTAAEGWGKSWRDVIDHPTRCHIAVALCLGLGMSAPRLVGSLPLTP